MGGEGAEGREEIMVTRFDRKMHFNNSTWTTSLMSNITVVNARVYWLL